MAFLLSLKSVGFSQTEAEEKVFKAIEKHDFSTLVRAVKSGFKPSHIYFSGPPDFKTTGLMEHAISSKFYKGAEFIIRQQSVPIRRSLDIAMSEKDDDAVRVFTNWACESQRFCAEYLFQLLKHHANSMAEEFVGMIGFNVDDRTMVMSGEYLGSSSGRNQQTPLHVCAVFQVPHIINIMLTRGGNVDVKDGDDYTPLYLSCRRSSVATCKMLLDHGANPSVKEPRKIYDDGVPRSPLHAICTLPHVCRCHDSIALLLLAAGIDVNKEFWLTANTQLSGVSQDIAELLIWLRKNPTSLESLCIREIRKRLSDNARGTSIFDRIENLPFPPIVIQTRFHLMYFID